MFGVLIVLNFDIIFELYIYNLIKKTVGNNS